MKIRKAWDINPVERVVPNKKRKYNRAKDKVEIKKQINNKED